MFHLIENTDLVEQACKQFLEPHPCLYNFHQEISSQLSLFPHIKLQCLQVQTQSTSKHEAESNNFRLNLLKNTKNSESCLVYLHGLSSYCLQGKFLIPFLGDNLSLCLYDLRAHGKNESNIVTYGLLESEELYQVIRLLIRKGFKNIILWGRSLGAATILRTIQKYGDQPSMNHVKYAIVDSPFSSFKKIASEIIGRLIALPQFITGLLAEAFMSKIHQKHGIDLKQLQFQGITSKILINFLHSSNDEMMNRSHIEKILQNYKGNKELFDIQVSHNEQRPQWIISKVIQNIRIMLKSKKEYKGQHKKKGLSIIKFNSGKFFSIVTCTNKEQLKRNEGNTTNQTVRNLVKSYAYENSDFKLFSQQSQVLESSRYKENNSMHANSQLRNINQLKQSKIRTITTMKDIGPKRRSNLSSHFYK